ncbi:hypothetical protein ABZ951_15725 [Streptomyces sp. NPDC046215]|uniref:Uncharacterized protein n=1 Tax=Streptomyces stramineus TaxID=173861 RepID=A0ABN2HFX0_9ACTN
MDTTRDPITALARADQPWTHPHPTTPAPLLHTHGPAAHTGIVVPPEQLAALITAAQLAQQAPPAPPPAATPVETRISGRAKGAALVTAAGGIGVGTAAVGIGYGAGLIADKSEGLMTAALAFGIGSGSLAALVLLLRFLFASRTSSGATTNHTTINQTVHASGWFSKGSIHNH